MPDFRARHGLQPIKFQIREGLDVRCCTHSYESKHSNQRTEIAMQELSGSDKTRKETSCTEYDYVRWDQCTRDTVLSSELMDSPYAAPVF